MVTADWSIQKDSTFPELEIRSIFAPSIGDVLIEPETVVVLVAISEAGIDVNMGVGVLGGIVGDFMGGAAVVIIGALVAVGIHELSAGIANDPAHTTIPIKRKAPSTRPAGKIPAIKRATVSLEINACRGSGGVGRGGGGDVMIAFLRGVTASSRL